MMYLVTNGDDKTVHPNLGRALLWCRGLGSMGIAEGDEPLQPLEVDCAREQIKAYGKATAAILFADEPMGLVDWADIEPVKEPSLEHCHDMVVLRQLSDLGLQGIETITRLAWLSETSTKRALNRLVGKRKAVQEKTTYGRAWRKR